MGREAGGGFKKEGTHVYLWLTHVDVWQKPSQYCEVIILQLKIKLKKKSLGLQQDSVQKCPAEGYGKYTGLELSSD